MLFDAYLVTGGHVQKTSISTLNEVSLSEMQIEELRYLLWWRGKDCGVCLEPEKEENVAFQLCLRHGTNSASTVQGYSVLRR